MNDIPIFETNVRPPNSSSSSSSSEYHSRLCRHSRFVAATMVQGCVQLLDRHLSIPDPRFLIYRIPAKSAGNRCSVNPSHIPPRSFAQICLTSRPLHCAHCLSYLRNFEFLKKKKKGKERERDSNNRAWNCERSDSKKLLKFFFSLCFCETNNRYVVVDLFCRLFKWKL